MILRSYPKNPKVNESLNPDSLRSFLHKVTECNQISIQVVKIQITYFGYSAHQPSNYQTLLTCTLMQVCCSRNIKCKTRVAALHSVFTHFLNYVRRYIRMSSSVWLLPPHRGMLSNEMQKNDFEELSENPKVNESLNPDLLFSFLNKVRDCNQINIKVERIQNYYFGYSLTSAIEQSNLIDMHVD